MATLKERREVVKKRIEAWRDRQAKEGKKGFNTKISKEAYKVFQKKKSAKEANLTMIEPTLK